MTVTTAYRQDFLGRWLTNNAQPGTTAGPADFLGRAVIASNKDYLGRLLTIDGSTKGQGAKWATGTAYTAGMLVVEKTGTDYDATFVALDDGTSHGSTEPTWPANIAATVVDNSGPNQITWQKVHL